MCGKLWLLSSAGMCKEHLGVALALKVPVFFVITKVRAALPCLLA